MPDLPPYIDIHTHRDVTDTGALRLLNKYEDFDQLESGKHYSLGIHPWYIHNAADQLQQLERHMGNGSVLAIGECGLDNLCTTDKALQKKVFAHQIHLANEQRKPLVIHCVRAFPETLSLLKEATVPAIFHGFRNKQSLADDILAAGHYLSFGAAILHPGATAAAVLAMVPDDRFFLETDDQAERGIREMYHAASFIRKTGKDAIILQLQKNFQNVLHT